MVTSINGWNKIKNLTRLAPHCDYKVFWVAPPYSVQTISLGYHRLRMCGALCGTGVSTYGVWIPCTYVSSDKCSTARVIVHIGFREGSLLNNR